MGTNFAIGPKTVMPKRIESDVMSPSAELSSPGRIFENWSLAILGVVAHAPLYYQLPRWADGLDPTFVHPKWIAVSPWPIVLRMANIHPIIWISIMVLCFVQLCRNFGWKLERFT
jgi:hypothetical protein